MRARTILLSADFPAEDEAVPASQLLDLEEALLSFARAALASEHTLALPADRIVAPLVAQIAAEYAAPPKMEAAEAPPPVRVLFTAGRDPELEQALAGHEGAWSPWHGEMLAEARGDRHPLTPEALRTIAPVFAMMLGGGRRLFEDFRMLRELQVPLHAVGAALSGPLREVRDAAEWDVTGQLLDEIGWGTPIGETDLLDEAERRVPYPYLMQRVVESSAL
jgi:hypothetical protein